MGRSHEGIRCCQRAGSDRVGRVPCRASRWRGRRARVGLFLSVGALLGVHADSLDVRLMGHVQVYGDLSVLQRAFGVNTQ
ncbi:hypothetical protein BDQ12DRAFT_684201 [Crucibulum laeve]|uniref:Uncharacterized protein n=1 Tax=Crucibulum laeve TaxID=68775 RepID=A0A5C3LZT0_9AGAR|nr:hypothetical protein BDQ12DRAFT_684201 [Crucibulum laeve]